MVPMLKQIRRMPLLLFVAALCLFLSIAATANGAVAAAESEQRQHQLRQRQLLDDLHICGLSLSEADINNDGILDRDEFTTFCHLEAKRTPMMLFVSAEQNIFINQDNVILPASLTAAFDNLLQKQQQMNANSVTVAGIDYNMNDNPAQQKAVLELLCHETIPQIAKLFEAQAIKTTDRQEGDIDAEIDEDSEEDLDEDSEGEAEEDSEDDSGRPNNDSNRPEKPGKASNGTASYDSITDDVELGDSIDGTSDSVDGFSNSSRPTNVGNGNGSDEQGQGGGSNNNKLCRRRKKKRILVDSAFVMQTNGTKAKDLARDKDSGKVKALKEAYKRMVEGVSNTLEAYETTSEVEEEAEAQSALLDPTAPLCERPAGRPTDKPSGISRPQGNSTNDDDEESKPNSSAGDGQERPNGPTGDDDEQERPANGGGRPQGNSTSFDQGKPTGGQDELNTQEDKPSRPERPVVQVDPSSNQDRPNGISGPQVNSTGAEEDISPNGGQDKPNTEEDAPNGPERPTADRPNDNGHPQGNSTGAEEVDRPKGGRDKPYTEEDEPNGPERPTADKPNGSGRPQDNSTGVEEDGKPNGGQDIPNAEEDNPNSPGRPTTDKPAGSGRPQDNSTYSEEDKPSSNSRPQANTTDADGSNSRPQGGRPADGSEPSFIEDSELSEEADEEAEENDDAEEVEGDSGTSRPSNSDNSNSPVGGPISPAGPVGPGGPDAAKEEEIDGSRRQLRGCSLTASFNKRRQLQEGESKFNWVGLDTESAEIYDFRDTPCTTSVTQISRQVDNEPSCVTVYGKYRVFTEDNDDIEKVYESFRNATFEFIAAGELEQSLEEVAKESDVPVAFEIEGASFVEDEEFDAFAEIEDDAKEALSTTDAPTISSTDEESGSNLRYFSLVPAFATVIIVVLLR